MRGNSNDAVSYSIFLGDEEIPYIVIPDQRSRVIKIRADVEKGIVVMLPVRARTQDAQRFVEQQYEWVVKQWHRIQKQREKFSDVMQPFLEKNTIVYLGREYQLIVDVGKRHWPPVVIEDDAIVVQCLQADLAEKILERWYRQQARAVISGAIELYRAQMGVQYESLAIKDQKTRWGSCSSKGNLNFSWRLILAPKDVLDYVVIHELAHLKEMNHSKRFWMIVERFCPWYKRAEKWLKENGVGLRI